MENSYLLYLGQAAYFLQLVSYCVRNVLWFRVLVIAASTVAIYFSFQADPDPLWIPIAWNFLFLITNLGQLFVSDRQKRAGNLSPLEDFLKQTVLANFPANEVKSFAAMGRENILPKGEKMIFMGSQIDHLYCILHGDVDIFVKEKKIAALHAGRFLGEMSLLTKSKARADVMTASELKVLIWSHEAIDKWVGTNAARLGLLQTAMGTQVVEELLRQQNAKANSEPERMAG